MICVMCGKNNVEGSRFCTSCGAKLSDAYDEDKSEITLDTPASDILDEKYSSEETLNESLSDAEETVTEAASDVEDVADNAFEEMKADAQSSDDQESSYSDAGSYSSSGIYDENQDGKPGFAIASLVCGCLSILCCCGACCMFPLPVVAIALGVFSIAKNLDGRGLSIAGIVTGGVGLFLQLIISIAYYSEGVFSEILGAF